MLSDISPIPMDGKPFSFTKRNANKAAAYIRNALGDAYIVDVVDAEFESAQKDLGPGIRISFTNRPEFFTAWANIHTVKITPYTVRILNSKGNTLIKRFNKTPVVNAGGMSFDLFKDDELEIRLSDSSQPINIISRAQYEPMELELHGATEDICEESAEDIWRLIDDLASAEIAVSVWRETLKGYSVDLIDASIIRVKRASTRNVWTFPLGTCWATSSPGVIDISMPGTEEVLRLYTEGGSPTETAQTHDPVNHPSHYTAYKGLEIIDLTEQMNFNRGNAVKYIARAGLKGAGDKEIEDLEKANWYISREIQRLREASSSRVVDRTFHSEDTLARVYTVIQQECGLDRNDTEQVVLSLLNNGILFRERA